MDMEIIPYKSIGPIKLGMTPEEVQQALGGAKYIISDTYEESDMGLERHFFRDLLIRVDYRRPGRCAFVEVSEPMNPVFRDRCLLRTPFSTLTKWFQEMDPETQVDTSGLKSPSLGIAFYAPGHDEEPDAYADDVALFEKDHYERAYSAAAEEHLADYQAASQKYGPDDPKTRECALHLSTCYELLGNEEEGAKWKKIWLEGE